MSHVDDGQLNALLDGELTAEEAKAVELHLASCATCTRRLEEARRFLTEANSLLEVLTPAARPAAAPPLAGSAPSSTSGAPPRRVATTSKETAIGEIAEPRRVSKTAQEPALDEASLGRRVPQTGKEPAVDIDGSTQKSPAIRPIFPREVDRRVTTAAAGGEGGKRRPDWTQLAWAASIVLALGVGYMAHEIRNAERGAVALRDEAPAAPVEGTRPTRAPAATPAPPAARASGAEERAGGTGAGAGVRSRTSREQGAAATGAPAKTAPTAARPEAPRDARPLDAPPAAPVPARPGEASGVAGAGAAAGGAAQDVSARAVSGVAGAPAPAVQPPARGAGAPAGERPAALAAREPSRARPATARAAARDDSAQPPSYRRISLDEAVRRLSGAIRLVDGINPALVEIGPGSLVSGADPQRDVIRVTYRDAAGRRFFLEQQRVAVETGALDAAYLPPAGRVNLTPGDTLVTSAPSGWTRIRWLDRKNFWLSVSGNLPADSLRALMERIR